MNTTTTTTEDRATELRASAVEALDAARCAYAAYVLALGDLAESGRDLRDTTKALQAYVEQGMAELAAARRRIA